MSRCAKLLHDYLCSTPPCSVHALVADFMSAGALHVSKNLGIPSYCFVPINASAFTIFSQLPSIRTEGQPTMKELGDTPPASHINSAGLDDPEPEKVLQNGIPTAEASSLSCGRRRCRCSATGQQARS